jgi:hypothetical protein
LEAGAVREAVCVDMAPLQCVCASVHEICSLAAVLKKGAMWQSGISTGTLLLRSGHVACNRLPS